MIWLEIILLAIVQGVAEFLPISSSGHIVVLAALFEQIGYPLHSVLAVNVALHMGTLLAILVFYWKRIWLLLSDDLRVIPLIVVGSVPAAVAGLVIKKYLGETFLESPLVAGFMFPLTGLLLLWAARYEAGATLCRGLTYWQALWIGCLQAFAILPGISRSGATISAALVAGMRRDEAAAFSFLLAIPVMAGAGLLELADLLQEAPGGTPWTVMAVGAALSFAVGLGALAWLIRWLAQGRLHLFAWWVFLLGAVVLAWQAL